MENVKNVTFDEIRVGATAEFRHTLSQADVELLALVSGDVDPFHLTGEGAARARPDARTTEAVGAQAIIAAALGTRLPGPGMTILRAGPPLPGHGRGRRRVDGDRDGDREAPRGAGGRPRLPVCEPAGRDAGGGGGHRGGPDPADRVRRAGPAPGGAAPRRRLRPPLPGLRGDLPGGLRRRPPVRPRLAARPAPGGPARADRPRAGRSRGQDPGGRAGRGGRPRPVPDRADGRTATSRPRGASSWPARARSRP